MKKQVRILVPAVVCLMLIMGADAVADTIMLYQGSAMVGKIISEDKTAIVFTNYFGTYRIKRIKIDDIYKTDSYEDDIALHRRLNLEYNEDMIKKNYTAGQDRKDGKKPLRLREPGTQEEAAPDSDQAAPLPTPEKETKKEPRADTTEGDHWKSGRLSFSGAFHYNLGSSSAALPYGYAGYFALDQGLDFTSGKLKPGIPGLRFEAGYVYFKKGSYSMTGYIAGGGLMWALPTMKNSWGCFIIALLPGATYLEVKISDSFFSFGSNAAKGFNFAGQALFGYQKSWGVFSIFVQARYMYILASRSYFHSIGGEAGFGFNAW